MEKLRAAYYTNTTSVEAIKSANIALMSDLWIADSVLKAAVLQTEANTRSTNQSQHKNTFLFRLDRKINFI